MFNKRKSFEVCGYPESNKLNSNILIFKSPVDLSQAKLTSSCDNYSKFISNVKTNLFIIQLIQMFQTFIKTKLSVMNCDKLKITTYILVHVLFPHQSFLESV